MAEIEIQRIGRAVAEIRVVGTAPLIINRFSEKAKQQMLDAQQGKKSVREHKDPEKLFQAARYLMEDGTDGIPAVSFKAAIVGAARYFEKSVSMTFLKQALFALGEGPEMLIPIEIEGPPRMREDTVRNATGVADLRYRPEYWPWAATLRVVYLPTSISLASVVALVDAAGIGGVGEWRPASKKSSTGMYGTFSVDDSFEVREIPATALS